MVKYFVRIDGEQRGPYTLEELPAAGVTPDTYVWCKGMDDWELASKDADICRFYRQRLAGVRAVSPEETPVKNGESEYPESAPERPMNFRDVIREVNRVYEEQMESEDGAPYSRPPRIPLALAIVSTLLCFPPTGFVAIYQCAKANKMWKRAQQSPEPTEEMRRAAHDVARSATMWTGITLCLGIIVWAAIVHFA